MPQFAAASSAAGVGGTVVLSVSHHMKLLVEAGLIHREQRGKWAYYSIVDGALAALAQALAPANTDRLSLR